MRSAATAAIWTQAELLALVIEDLDLVCQRLKLD
jgi:hypothetical protein